MRPAELAPFDGQVVTATLQAPVKRGRSYTVETSTHTGRLHALGKGCSIDDPATGRMKVATMAAYVVAVELAP